MGRPGLEPGNHIARWVCSFSSQFEISAYPLWETLRGEDEIHQIVVATSKDNAAVWAISSVMESDVSAFKAVSDSLALGESTVAVARNASEQVKDTLVEIKSKIIAAQEENVDRDKIQADVDALRAPISAMAASFPTVLAGLILN